MLGLEMAGFQTVVANEVHADPCKTLRRNFPEVPVVQGSLRDLSAKDLLAAAVSVDEIDLVAGGPPCQGFSTAGLKDPADPRNTLIGDFVRIVKKVQPRFFLLENVTGLLTLHNGRLFENVLGELDQLGYQIDHRVLHAADYGVPQMRKRLVVLGARDETLPPFPEARFRPPAETTLSDAELPIYIGCGDALGDIPPIGPGEICTTYDDPPRTPYQREMRQGATTLHNHQASKHRPETVDYYALVPPGGTWLDIPQDRRKRKQGIQRWPLDGLARTITSEPTDFLHPVLDRIPTIRELARIQSFPDRFEFLGQRTTGNKMRRLGYCAQSQQVGNAVPPLLAEAVGKSIYAAAHRERRAAA
jgi:DNA (cytosine-5)-methyltransferase 1